MTKSNLNLAKLFLCIYCIIEQGQSTHMWIYQWKAKVVFYQREIKSCLTHLVYFML